MNIDIAGAHKKNFFIKNVLTFVQEQRVLHTLMRLNISGFIKYVFNMNTQLKQ